jgi:multidrug resistance efflux pump
MKKFDEFQSVSNILSRKNTYKLVKFLLIFSGIMIILLLFPWTQTISSPGKVTAISPNNRPQTIHATIGGRIEKWYVSEGQFIEKGDTILYLSEIKSEYFDPNLIQRTESQRLAKENSVASYMQKVKSLDNQIDALIDARIVKLQQAENKIKQLRFKIVSDSMDYKANSKQLEIAVKQYERTEELNKRGLKSTTELENKRFKVQEYEAKEVSFENKLLTTRNDLLNAINELRSIDADYRDKIAKSEAEKATTLSNLYDTEANVTKIQNQISNYTIRSGFYYVTAPQSGYVSQALKNGVGETVKEGSPLVSIVPVMSDFGVEIFVEPIDLPLIHLGNRTRIQFDGWPAIVFSGWPNVSYGTYGGTVVAIDNSINAEGKYRVLVAPDKTDHKWPKLLKMGVAVKSMTLLNDVPIWYELWRKINGFPPNYYTPKTNVKLKTK